MRLDCFPKPRGLAILCLILCLYMRLIITAQAWGPHPEITQAALNALGTNDPLVLQLGRQAQRLTNYAWMADYRRLPFEEPDEVFYADDYLMSEGRNVVTVPLDTTGSLFFRLRLAPK